MVLNIENIKLSPSTGEELRGNCPFCNDKKGHLYINRSKSVFYCHRCGTGGRIGSSEPISKTNYYRDFAANKAEIDVNSINRAYNALLDILDLSAEHYRQLIQDRKLTTAQIYQKGYRSLPSNSRIKIASKVSEKARLDGVPGFYKFKGKKWCLAGPEGLLIPVRNFSDDIWGMQIRINNPKYDMKYCWLSSADRQDKKRPAGTGANSVYHVAKAGNNPRKVWITEGPLKGDIASYIMEETFVCVPGVNAWRKSGLIKDLAKNGVREAIIAYDADAFSNINIARAADKLYKALAEAKIKALIAIWRIDKGKGIDDMLQNGHVPEMINYKNWREEINSKHTKGKAS